MTTSAVQATLGWRGTTTLEPGRLAFTGAAGRTGPHAHAAVRILLVATGQVELSDGYGTRRPVRVAIIPTRTRHALHATPDAVATMLRLDPVSVAAGHLTIRPVGGDRDRVDGWVAAAHTLLPARSGSPAWPAPCTCQPPGSPVHRRDHPALPGPCAQLHNITIVTLGYCAPGDGDPSGGPGSRAPPGPPSYPEHPETHEGDT